MFDTHKKFFLFVFRSVKGIVRNSHFRLSLIPVCIQSITAAQNKCNDTKYLQVKEKNRRMYPVMREVFFFRILVFKLFVMFHRFLLQGKNKVQFGNSSVVLNYFSESRLAEKKVLPYNTSRIPTGEFSLFLHRENTFFPAR